MIRSNLYKLKKAAAYAKHYGPAGLAKKALGKVMDRDGYAQRFRELAPTAAELSMQSEKGFSYMPLISVLVPVYDPPEQYLKEMLLSVTEQTYPRWQLCIVDAGRKKLENFIREVTGEDERVRYLAADNEGIGGNTNRALAMAEGDYIALLDNDDTLAPDALWRMAETINREKWEEEGGVKYPDCLYSDEDKTDSTGERHFAPHVKEDYNPGLLRTNNYICHLFMVRTKLAREVGGFFAEYDGAQDFDFILRCTERAKKVSHVGRILYHWRTHEGSTSGNPLSKEYAYDAGRRAVEAHLKRLNIPGTVEMLKDMGFYRVRYGEKGKGKLPHVKILVSGVRDKETVQKYFRFLRKGTEYENLSLCAMAKPDPARLGELECDYFMVLLQGTEPEEKDWLATLVSRCEAEKDDGAAAKLMIGGFLGYAGRDRRDAFGVIHPNAGKPGWYKGYFNRVILQSDVDSIPETGILVRREAYIKLLEGRGKAGYDRLPGMRFAYEPNAVLKLKRGGKEKFSYD